MNQTVAPDWGSNLTVSEMTINVLKNTTTEPGNPDEIQAGVFIIVVILFFSFVILSFIVVHQFYVDPKDQLIINYYVFRAIWRIPPVNEFWKNPPGSAKKENNDKDSASGPTSAPNEASEEDSYITTAV